MDQDIKKLIDTRIRWDIINKIKDVATRYEDSGHDFRIEVSFNDVPVYKYSTIRGEWYNPRDESFEYLSIVVTNYIVSYSYVVNNDTGDTNHALTYEMCNRLRKRFPSTNHFNSIPSRWYKFTL